MNALGKLFLKGLAVVIPLALTVAILWWLSAGAEKLLGGLLVRFLPQGWYVPGMGLVAGLVKFVWVATVLVWPVLKWVLAIITFFQFVRMLYHWNTPGVYAGWSFLAYFAALTAITYFVSIYKPKGL